MYAEFESVDGLRVGSPVLLAGVKVGSVTEISLDTKTYFAKTRLELDRSILIPEDSEAIIVSDGLLGEKYVSVNVGGADSFLKNGDQFLYTQGSVNIINLLNQFSAR